MVGKPETDPLSDSPVRRQQEIHRVVTCPDTLGIMLLVGCVPHSELIPLVSTRVDRASNEAGDLVMSGRLMSGRL